MEFGEVMGMVLPVVYVVVGIALIWFVVELVVTVRKTRATVDEMKQQLDPTLESVQRITKSLEPCLLYTSDAADELTLV